MTNKIYDFAFTGNMTPYRAQKIAQIRNLNYTVDVLTNLWGLARDSQIAKSRYLLNLHQSPEHRIFESCRCAMYLNTTMGVYSEDSLDLPSEAKLISKLKTKIIIYVLCHTNVIYTNSLSIYAKYTWAVPILMKYQDESYENAFWKQLLEIKDDWINCEMVGTISGSAHNKINLDALTKQILNFKSWMLPDFHHFYPTRINFDTDNSHPFLQVIIRDLKTKLNIVTPKIVYASNYWMTTPNKMLLFIEWNKILMEKALEHPKIKENANYKRKYYSHLPFVIERLNPCFFI